MKEYICIESPNEVEGGILVRKQKLIRCKDCIHNVANRQTDPLDTADYSGIDIVCDYFMTDGQETDDYCSHAEPKEKKDE